MGSSGQVTFQVKKLRGIDVLGARVTVWRATRRVSSRAVERAAVRGRMTVRLPRSWRRRTARLRVQVAPTGRGPSGFGWGERPPSPRGPCGVDLSQMVDGRRPPSCWRPYNDSSPFNQPLPASPRLSSSSWSVVQKMVGFGRLQNMFGGDAGDWLDAGRPMYVSKPTDPLFTVHCYKDWGPCDIEGDRVRIPREARVPGHDDKHLTVVDPSTGTEWDFWQVRPRQAGGGTLSVAWGGKTAIAGNGLGSDAVAAQTATMAGVVRAEELAGGEINHAIAIAVRCDSGEHVYPAAKVGLSCAQAGESSANAPAMGTRFQLNMTPTQIEALPVPAYRKTLFRAMATYGMYVIDTGSGSWGIIQESGLVTTSFGAPEVWEDLAKAVGARFWAPEDRWVLNVRDGIDWDEKLRVIHPCVSSRSC